MKNKMKNHLILSRFFAVLIVLQAPAVYAEWGARDTSFGFLGVYTDNCSADCTPRDVALQSDGKILVTGAREVSGKTRFFLRRYLANGSVDTSFGSSGYAVSNALIVVDSEYSGSSIAVQPDGKIVVAGTVRSFAGGFPETQLAVWRFHASGAADTSFGAYGMRTYSKFWEIRALDIAVQQGKLIAAYTDQSATFAQYGRLMRLNSNGSIDTSFGGGTISLSYGSFISQVLIEAETSKIVYSYGDYSSLFERRLPDGGEDTSFQATYNDLGSIAGIVRLGSGKFLVAGYGSVSSGVSYRNVARYSADGIWEYRTPDYDDANGNQFNFLGVQQDGRVVVGSPNGFYRLSPNLTSFLYETYTGSNLPAMGLQAYEKRVTMQPDDKLIIVSKSSTGRIVLTRVLPE